MSKYMQLFTTFCKIGAFTFGGGYAMIPLIQKEVVEKKKWINEEDLINVFAVAESTPGPVAINSATFVGYRTGGVLGAFAATIGVVLPSFLIILALSYVISWFESLTVVKYAFEGIRAGVLALILQALFTMFKHCPKNRSSIVLIALSFVLVTFFSINTIFVIIACGLIGMACYLYGVKH